MMDFIEKINLLHNYIVKNQIKSNKYPNLTKV